MLYLKKVFSGLLTEECWLFPLTEHIQKGLQNPAIPIIIKSYENQFAQKDVINRITITFEEELKLQSMVKRLSI